MNGTLLKNEPLAKHTSWRVGGPADRYYEPAGREDLAREPARAALRARLAIL